MTPEEFTTLRRTLSDRLIQALLRLFGGLTSWRDADAAQFVAQAVPLVEGAQRTMATLVANYVAAQATAAAGRVIAPAGIPDSLSVDLRKGVSTRDVYQRPFVQLYSALAKGKPLPDAVELAKSRLEQIAEMDMQKTYAETARAAMKALPESVRPSSWRRVLVGAENCAMCIVASTQRYHLEKLNPIHPGCDCRVDPVFGKDPGQVIDAALLEQVHAAVKELTGKSDRGARAPDYRKLIVQMTPEHGELGPMLVRPLDKFTGAGDLPAS